MVKLPVGTLVDLYQRPYDVTVRGILVHEAVAGAYTVATIELPSAEKYRSEGIVAAAKCQCGNWLKEHEATLCDWCLAIESEPPHKGHWSWLGGTWWCDTCDSPLCNLL